MSYAIPSLTRVPATEKGLTIGDFLVPVRVGERTSPRIRHALLIAAGALFIFLCAKVWISIPGNPVPYTLQSFGVLVVGGALGLRRGGAAALLYVLLGLVGLPFFAEGKGGLQVIWAATGGYLVGFVVAAAVVGRLAELGWDRRIGGAIGATAIGTVVIYAIGVPWLAVVTGASLIKAIELGVVPFLGVDIVKLLAAAAVFPAAWWVVGRRPSDR
ncbi:MAG TPA: biotin transporter BioY [Candidatus Limnocylindrales bacterium]|nr:biotin transporter BioY [Candidatus Limnocylindrales bacterium]